MENGYIGKEEKIGIEDVLVVPEDRRIKQMLNESLLDRGKLKKSINDSISISFGYLPENDIIYFQEIIFNSKQSIVNSLENWVLSNDAILLSDSIKPSDFFYIQSLKSGLIFRGFALTKRCALIYLDFPNTANQERSKLRTISTTYVSIRNGSSETGHCNGLTVKQK